MKTMALESLEIIYGIWVSLICIVVGSGIKRCLRSNLKRKNSRKQIIPRIFQAFVFLYIYFLAISLRLFWYVYFRKVGRRTPRVSIRSRGRVACGLIPQLLEADLQSYMRVNLVGGFIIRAPPEGTCYVRLQFLNEIANRNEPCWICRVDYISPYTV